MTKTLRKLHEMKTLLIESLMFSYFRDFLNKKDNIQGFFIFDFKIK